MTTVHNQIHDTLKRIKEKRSTIHIEKATQFYIDDWVLVDRRNLLVKAGNNKSLTQKWLVPYKVIKPIGSHAYRLEVPEATCWHNVVHSTLLKPFRRRDEPQDMDKDEAEVWEVEEIVNSRTVKGVVQYRLRWAGCTEFENTWETIDHLYNCPVKLKEFRQKFGRKPRDEEEVGVRPQASGCQSKLLEMELLHGTFHPSYSLPFPTGFLARSLVSNGHGMHV